MEHPVGRKSGGAGAFIFPAAVSSAVETHSRHMQEMSPAQLERY